MKESELYLRVPCTTCGVNVGERCMRKNGEPYSPALSHEGRKRIALAVNAGALPQPDEEATSEETSTFEQAVAAAKAERVKKVLWAIGFARNIMNVPQAELDMRLAIMLVDAEMDVRLF